MKNIKLIILLALVYSLTGLVSSCNRNKSYVMPGYVEGRFTYISSDAPGVLKTLNVAAGQKVQKGELLFNLDPLPQSAELLEASSRVDQAMAQKNQADIEYQLQKTKNDRNVHLFQRNVISKEELDVSTAAYEDASAKKKAADANLSAVKANQNRSEWGNQRRAVLAPMSALVFDTYYTEHEQVSADRPVLSLLIPENIKIIFFAPEDLISGLKLNQMIEATCDGCTKPIKAKITYLSAKSEFTPPVIFSKEERNHLVFRVEALPVIENNQFEVHIGQPVTVRINLNEVHAHGK